MSKLNDVQVNEHVAKTRGFILHYCTYVEKLIDESISKYFCTDIDIRQDLLNFILCTERVTFGNKLMVFNLIIEKESLKEGDNKYKAFKNNYPKYNNELVEYAVTERNVFAHNLFDSTEGYVERFNDDKIIRFIKFKVTKDKPNLGFLDYNDSRIQEITSKLKLYGTGLMIMNEL